MPRTRWGRWSVELLVAFVLLFLASNALAASGQRGGDTFSDNLVLAVPMFLAGLCAIAALPIGATAIIRSRERSALVFLSAATGLLILVFVAGELVSPH